MTVDDRDFRELYRRATDYSQQAFSGRPYVGSPGAPAQDETNPSNLWAHLNGGFLTAYEHTRWWKEARAVRESAVLGDWSWLGKVRITGPDAPEFMQYATFVDLTDQTVGDIQFMPMVNEAGHIALEGVNMRLGPQEYLFTQSAAKSWFDRIDADLDMDVTIEDVTPDFTVFAVQGPESRAIVEAVSGEDLRDLSFATFRRSEVLETEVIINRVGVTGELGYEFLLSTESGLGAELWRTIREVGQDYNLRELGFRAMNIPHTEVGIATAIRDYIPARMPPEQIPRLAKHWMAKEDLDSLEYDLSEHFCSPGELGWGNLIHVDHDCVGRQALVDEKSRGGPAYRWTGLRWKNEDLISLFADQFGEDGRGAPPDFPYGQFRMEFLEITHDGTPAGWATGWTYSPNVRGVISNARITQSISPGTEVTVHWRPSASDEPYSIAAEVTNHPIVQDKRRVEVDRS